MPIPPSLESEIVKDDSLSQNDEYVAVSDLEGYLVLTKEEFTDILTEAVDKASEGSVEIAYQEDLRPQLQLQADLINELEHKNSMWKTVSLVLVIVLVGGTAVMALRGN